MAEGCEGRLGPCWGPSWGQVGPMSSWGLLGPWGAMLGTCSGLVAAQKGQNPCKTQRSQHGWKPRGSMLRFCRANLASDHDGPFWDPAGPFWDPAGPRPRSTFHCWASLRPCCHDGAPSCRGGEWSVVGAAAQVLIRRGMWGILPGTRPVAGLFGDWGDLGPLLIKVQQQ